MANFKNLFSTIVGNLLEYYDFLLFIHLNSILATLFFPHQEPSRASILILSFSTIGILARPFGAILFGNLSDKIGRKRALSLSIICIALPTFILGCLPTYQQMGLLSTIGLLLCRIFQGVSVGGEYCNAGIFLMESTPASKRGYYSSILSSSSSLGSLLALFTAFIISIYINKYPDIWRVPFILGAFLGIAGFKLRQKSQESIELLQSQKEQVPRPSWTSILKQWKSLGFIISIAALVSALIWIPISFVPFYLMHFKRYSFQEVLPFTALTLILHILFMILTGLLSQKINYYRLMIIGAWATCIFSFPLFYYLINGHLIAFIIGLTFLSAIFGTVVHAVMLNIFPIQSRGRGISLGFMIGSSLGGASPSICAYLIKITDNHFAPALYLMMLALQWIIWRRFYLKNKLFSPKQNISGRID